MIKIQRASIDHLTTLQELSRRTFYEAFAASNTEADMQQYSSNNFSVEKLSNELNEANSQFFIACDEEIPVGYLKVNFEGAQTDLKENHSIEIERIYVMSAYHGKCGTIVIWPCCENRKRIKEIFGLVGCMGK